MIKTKEDLLGTKVRYEGEAQWEIIKAVCLSLGIEPALRSGCSYQDGSRVVYISHEVTPCTGKKVSSVRDALWEGTRVTTLESLNLREISFSEFENFIKDKSPTPKYKYAPVEVESFFDLKDMFNKGELYFKASGDRDDNIFGVVYDKITTEEMLFTRFYEKRLLKREEVKWQDEVEEFLLKCNSGVGMFDIVYGNGNELALADEDFLEAARIALQATGELK